MKFPKSTTATRRAARLQRDMDGLIHVSQYYVPDMDNILTKMGLTIFKPAFVDPVSGLARGHTIDNGGNDERYMRDALGFRSRQQYQRALTAATA